MSTTDDTIRSYGLNPDKLGRRLNLWARLLLLLTAAERYVDITIDQTIEEPKTMGDMIEAYAQLRAGIDSAKQALKGAQGDD
jgi:hypothetical protein